MTSVTAKSLNDASSMASLSTTSTTLISIAASMSGSWTGGCIRHSLLRCGLVTKESASLTPPWHLAQRHSAMRLMRLLQASSMRRRSASMRRPRA